MMSPQLKHVLQLIERTGDRVVVFDASSDEAFVVMSLKGYEKLVDTSVKVPLTASEKNGNLQPVTEPWEPVTALEPPHVPETRLEEERFYIEPVE